MALESSKYHEIVNITGISFVQDVKPLPLFQLITKSFSDDHLDSSNNRGMFVTLPDQSHCYFLSDHKSMSGYKIKKIPFSHPGQVPRILAILRQQAVFNSVISSCIRSSGIQDLEKSHLLEVSCMDLSRLCVTFEMSQGMATFELDFTDFQNVQCKLHKLSSNDLGLNTLMTKQVFEKTLSLPLTMRSLIKQALKKSRPLDPDPDPQVMYNNGNLDNGQVVHVKPGNVEVQEEKPDNVARTCRSWPVGPTAPVSSSTVFPRTYPTTLPPPCASGLQTVAKVHGSARNLLAHGVFQ